MKSNQKSTIYDIAEKAGTSPSAVSAALNGDWKKRRLHKDTVERIRRIAREHGYSVNRQARGLRKAQSGLAGMMLPDHDNRFFAELSQCFAVEAHLRDLCPAIVHSGRDASAQLRSVESLISYGVDLVVIAGASDPRRLAQACRDADLPHVFVDHPCKDAPSVVTDNLHGAAALTRSLLADMPPAEPGSASSWLYFLGGEPKLPASAERIQGFRTAAQQAGALWDDTQIIACGYHADRAADELLRLCDRLGGLPAGLFVNSIVCFEGVARVLAAMPERQITGRAFGCFDYDPFGALLRFPLHMVRQRADLIIAEAYRQLDEGSQEPGLVRVAPDLI